MVGPFFCIVFRLTICNPVTKFIWGMKMHCTFGVSLFFLLITLSSFYGCAPVTARPTIDPVMAEKEAAIQKRMAVEERVKMLHRLSTVAQPILVNGTPLCGDEVTYYLGMDTNSVDAIPEDWRETYKDVLNLEDRVTVTNVLPNSPAEDGGVMVGDVVLMMNGNKIEPGKTCYKDFQKKLSKYLKAGQTMVLWVEREGIPRMVQIEPVKRCDYPVVLTDDIIVNAYADGESVMVTKGMMDFADKDEDLALVIGHELGHNVMDHIEKKSGNRILGAIVDGLIGGLTGVHTTAFQNAAGMAYSQDYEQEADYVGVYFMERGGYNSKEAPMFWRKMGANFPYAISHATTHPTSASRYVFLEKCAAEVKEKEKQGKELLPEYENTKVSN